MGARTGDAYLDSLRDGRQVWHAGRQIEDVTTHPGFVGAAATLARLYDLQHDAACQHRLNERQRRKRHRCNVEDPSPSGDRHPDREQRRAEQRPARAQRSPHVDGGCCTCAPVLVEEAHVRSQRTGEG